jgi:hypothetical protein
MMVKSAQPGAGVGVHALLLSTIISKAVVYAPAERADTLPVFLFYPYVYSDVTSNVADIARSTLYMTYLLEKSAFGNTTVYFRDSAVASHLKISTIMP